MEVLSRQVEINGKIAYVSQQAWIQNMTVRNNILFSNPYDSDKYQQIIKACALGLDLKLLSHGDLTEIGENGINLSGGQKQRIALARAVYFDGDVYLLDDPLSAVDAHVGKLLFENVISKNNGLLKDKTRIWVTNQVSYLPFTDKVIFMKDGKVLEQGSYQELMKLKGSLFDFVQQHLMEDEDTAQSEEINNEQRTDEKSLENVTTQKSLNNDR